MASASSRAKDVGRREGHRGPRPQGAPRPGAQRGVEPDSKRVLTRSEDGTAKVWLLEELLAAKRLQNEASGWSGAARHAGLVGMGIRFWIDCQLVGLRPQTWKMRGKLIIVRGFLASSSSSETTV